ncbi:MAG: DNA-binding response OmpR family regulator [Halocynthiibacter sp.]
MIKFNPANLSLATVKITLLPEWALGAKRANVIPKPRSARTHLEGTIMRILLADTTWTSATAAADLRTSGFFVTQVNDGAELLDFAKDGAQSAIIFDQDLPDEDGASILRKLRALHPQLPIFVLTSETEWSHRKHLFDLGADDVIVGEFSTQELSARVRAAVRRTGGFALPQLPLGALAIDTCTQTVSVEGNRLHLTRKEYEILEMLALSRDRMVSRDEIMSQLYAWEDEPSVRIINVYLSRIRAQIAAAGGNQDVVETVWGLGYRLNVNAQTGRIAA